MDINRYLDKEPESEPPDELYPDPEKAQEILDADPEYMVWLDILESQREENDNRTTEAPVSKRASSL